MGRALRELITGGPYSLVKPPLYTCVALLVLPWLGFLFNTWLGVVIGVALYAGCRIFAPKEEAGLLRSFGPAWQDYLRKVKIPWL
jgi:protein-S-isoprenylcysteine O-methyltransferase Ste14